MTVLPSLDSFRCFVEVAQRLNFRAAAKAVALTPAAVSARIRQLEDQVGQPLFSRTTRSVELTDAGLALLPAARDTLVRAERAMRRARGELGPSPLDLTIGTRHELGMSWLLPALPVLQKQLPHVTFHLSFGAGADLLARVREGTLPCAIGSMRHVDAGLTGDALHEERYALVASPKLLKRTPVRSPEHLKLHRLVDADPSLPLASYLRDVPGGAQLTFGELRSMGTIAAVRALTLQGEGVAVLPEYLVRDDLVKRRLERVLPRLPLKSDWFRLISRTGDERAPLFAAIARALRDLPLR
ncbi:MAG: LysR family transcriptional regulator [Archangium gephyra]|uniref:LysR family transcriptional regulator n=1 Tax=Archangium gephyra TaxID=48 RepID=A0A2W5TZZ2_9BACT|nr:MAG: LysR family transcriptional regulator [Archangium gephyra]